mmetsp:Transcript_3532/g.13250  ORF Transcript_3532/g.13250 Transcript_3532/m.13250 type:complete len:215 (-) Transcript_3532:328-972(-)
MHVAGLAWCGDEGDDDGDGSDDDGSFRDGAGHVAIASPDLASQHRHRPSPLTVNPRPLRSATPTMPAGGFAGCSWSSSGPWSSSSMDRHTARSHRPATQRHSVATAARKLPRQFQSHGRPGWTLGTSMVTSPDSYLRLRARMRASSASVSLRPKYTTNILRQKLWLDVTWRQDLHADVAESVAWKPAPSRMRSTQASGRSPHGTAAGIFSVRPE